MEVKKTNHKNILYDENSGALLNSSDDELLQYQAQRRRVEKEKSIEKRLAELEARLKVLEEKINV